jgi:hypothetical protein
MVSHVCLELHYINFLSGMLQENLNLIYHLRQAVKELPYLSLPNGISMKTVNIPDYEWMLP